MKKFKYNEPYISSPKRKSGNALTALFLIGIIWSVGAIMGLYCGWLVWH